MTHRWGRRRDFLQAAGLAIPALAMTSWPAWAIGTGVQVGFGQLKHAGNWDPRPEALRRLLWEIRKRTSIEVRRDATFVDMESDDIFQQPFLVLTGKGPMPEWSEKARQNVARHLRFGGFLYVDTPSPDDPFTSSVKREVEIIRKSLKGNQEFDSPTFQRVDPQHVLFKSFFLLKRVVGRHTQDTGVVGLDLDKRMVLAMTQNDLLGALERDRLGNWVYTCEPGGERQREMAIRFGVNLIMYATCLDYKSDQVHIPFILKKRRR
ncbi:MAG: hypothetical protein CMH56_11480 [Myxococcales bacterium]|nr:hypothetical protein [Myxococcales bacterium]|tara:strand:- start:3806 stop:4597 length:792 start_codon:yes stop_codon:yes gene_type:complete